MYIHSVYKESPRHYLSTEIKDHKFWKFKTHFYSHHSSKPGHITVETHCIQSKVPEKIFQLEFETGRPDCHYR